MQAIVPIQQINRETFLSYLASNWEQGEHMLLTGPTGTGKTTLASSILDLRHYVIVIAVKPHDDTLSLFLKKKYHKRRAWPIDYHINRVLLWFQPKTFGEVEKQRSKCMQVLEDVYISGGWTLFLDESGYLAGMLSLDRHIGLLLNQGRSNNLTIVLCMTQPKSMVARVPSETLKQCKHLIIFKYTNVDEIKACASICGIPWKDMVQLSQQLSSHGFLYFHGNTVFIVEE